MEYLYNDVIIYVTTFLQQKDLINLMRVSKRFYNLINNLKLPNVDIYTACKNSYYLNINKYIKSKKRFKINKAFTSACK
ncbi:MAG: F-box protein, partial [Candidatus Nanoarchaeia archaeon]|nr:F-box protein [Candidatus Jingweiarchaeum tengchongense]